MSVPAFGFSAGDFIAAVGLAVNVTNALKDVGGASEQYRILVQELNSLERVVRKLHARQGTENVFPEDITKQTDMTLETLGSFLKTISKFNSKLGPNAASGWHHGVGRKAQWAVAYAKEVEKLRVKLGTHLAQLNMLLQIYASARCVHWTLGIRSILPDQVAVLISYQGRGPCKDVGQYPPGHRGAGHADVGLTTRDPHQYRQPGFANTTVRQFPGGHPSPAAFGCSRSVPSCP